MQHGARRIGVAVLALTVMLALGSCQQDSTPVPRLFAAHQYPQQLSAWQVVFAQDGKLAFGRNVHSYDINMPLFSDYAGKLRTLWLPDNTQLTPHADERNGFVYPVGSIISKTFFYQSAATNQVAAANQYRTKSNGLDLDRYRPIETRLMVRHDNGWQAVSYQWQGNDATLAITGAIVPLALSAPQPTELNYLIPSRNQCASCHATNHSTGELRPIGLRVSQLDRADPHTEHPSQLLAWQAKGWLANDAAMPTQPALPTWQEDAPIADKARAYLASNCAHCHSPNGPADTSALDLTLTNHDSETLGICKAPVAAGRGSGGRLYGVVPGDADASILVHRLASTKLSSRMPEVGRSLRHDEGVALVSAWVNSLSGECR